MTSTRTALALAAFVALLIAPACMVGPKYRKPDVPLTPAFKEPLPEGWKQGEPSDGKIPGKWWEMYHDPRLNALEEQVAISNQNVLAFEAQYREARAAVRVARSALFPTVTAAPSITRTSTNSASSTLYSFPAGLSWETDLWGSIRRSVNAASAQAQATAADLANATLSYQSELAQDYFLLHGVDGDIDLLQRTAQLYRDYLNERHHVAELA